MTTYRLLSEITPLEIARKALELAQASPDFRYQIPEKATSCVYVITDEDGLRVGSCLFGQALVELGVDPSYLSARNGKGIDDLVDTDSGAFGTVQGLQDVGIRWGSDDIVDALKNYIEAHS